MKGLVLREIKSPAPENLSHISGVVVVSGKRLAENGLTQSLYLELYLILILTHLCV